MKTLRLPPVLACLALVLCCSNDLEAQRPKPGSSSSSGSAPSPAPAPRPSVSPAPRPSVSPAPRPSAMPSMPSPRPSVSPAPRPNVNPAPSAPRPMPGSFSQPSPRPTPSPASTPRPSTPRPSATIPQPTYTPPVSNPARPSTGSTRPNTQPSRPQTGSTRPTYTTPQTPGGVRTPGSTRPNTNSGSSSQPSVPGARPGTSPYTPSRPVGGSIKIVDRDTTSTTPTPRPNTGGSVGGSRPSSNVPGGRPSSRPSSNPSDRPASKPTVVDRYEPVATPRPRGDRGDAGSRPAGNAQVKPSNPGLTPRPRANPSPTTTQIVDRYQPGRPTVGPRGPSDTRPAPRPNGAFGQPTLSSRPVTNAFVPGLTRPRTTTNGILSGAGYYSGGSYCGTRPYYGGSCYGPVWNPCRPIGAWNPWCSSTPSWCVGVSFGYGYGSTCWGWSSWYPWGYCAPRSRWWWSIGYCDFNPWWYRSCYTPIYWMPATYYSPVVYETTYVYSSSPAAPAASDAALAGGVAMPGDEPVFARGAKEATAEEQGRRYVDYGDYYFREGRYRDAVDAYAKARTLLPADASLHFVMADAVFAVADYHFAAFLIGEGLRLEPGLARAETDKRLLYSKPETFEEQMAALRRYIDSKPYDAMAQLVLAYNLKFSLQAEKALAAFRRVLEIDPSNAAARIFVEALTTPPEAAAEAETPAPGVGGSIEVPAGK